MNVPVARRANGAGHSIARPLHKPTIVGCSEMLQIKSVRPDQIPRTIEYRRERPRRRKRTRLAILEKRQRKKRFRAIEEKDKPMSFLNRIALLPGMRGDLSRAGMYTHRPSAAYCQ